MGAEETAQQSFSTEWQPDLNPAKLNGGLFGVHQHAGRVQAPILPSSVGAYPVCVSTPGRHEHRPLPSSMGACLACISTPGGREHQSRQFQWEPVRCVSARWAGVSTNPR